MIPPACEQQGCAIPKDRDDWGPGPWRGEPDRVDFRAFGLDCFVHRNHPEVGVWCGYVGVPRSNAAFGHHHDEVDVEVHGGLTFAGKCVKGHHICHGRKGARWWLGYDTCHSGDFAPGMAATLAKIFEEKGEPQKYKHRHAKPGENLLPVFGAFEEEPDGTHVWIERYWSVDDVIRETTQLAKQLSTFTHHKLTKGYSGKELKRISKIRDPKRQREKRMKVLEKIAKSIKKWSEKESTEK